MFIFFNLFSKVPDGLRLGASVISNTGQLCCLSVIKENIGYLVTSVTPEC